MSTILKAGTSPRGSANPSPFHMRDLLEEAQAIIRRARQDAADIVAQARHESRGIRETARRAGHAEGQQSGLAAGREAGHQAAHTEAAQRFAEEQAQLTGMLEALIERVNAERVERLHAAERELLDFALLVARKVTQGIGRIEPQAARANLEAAIAHVVGRSDFVVHAHPQDLDTLQRFASDAAESVARQTHITLHGDAAISPGGVRVQAHDTTVDATLDGQLDMIVEALVGAPTEESEDPHV